MDAAVAVEVNTVKIGLAAVREERPGARFQLERILKDIRSAKQNYISLGFHLNELKESRYYEDFGYMTFDAFCAQNVPLDAGTISRCMAVWREFCDRQDGTPKMWLSKQYEQYSYSQLSEMLPLEPGQREKIKPEMTIRQIREYKQNLKAEKRKEEKRQREALEYRDPYLHQEEEQEPEPFEPEGNRACARDTSVECHLEENRKEDCNAVCCAICKDRTTCSSVCEVAKREKSARNVDFPSADGIFSGKNDFWPEMDVKIGGKSAENVDFPSADGTYPQNETKLSHKTGENVDFLSAGGVSESWEKKREKLEQAAHRIGLAFQEGQKEELIHWMNELKAAVQELGEKAAREHKNF